MQQESHLVDLTDFAKACTENTGIDCTKLQHGFLRRRYRRVLRALGADSWRDLQVNLEENPNGWLKVEYLLSVHVSEFFRHPDHFEWLGNFLEERSAEVAHRLSVLVYGCAHGEELWSAAIVAREHGLGDVRLVGSDASLICLNRARSGRYSRQELETLGEERRRKWFQGAGRQAMEVGEELRENAEIVASSSLEDGEERFDALFARNWLIFLERDAIESRVADMLGFLHPGGALFVAPTEKRLLDGIEKLEEFPEAPRGVFRYLG